MPRKSLKAQFSRTLKLAKRFPGIESETSYGSLVEVLERGWRMSASKKALRDWDEKRSA